MSNQEVLKKMLSKTTQEVEIPRTHNQERQLGKFDTDRTYCR